MNNTFFTQMWNMRSNFNLCCRSPRTDSSSQEVTSSCFCREDGQGGFCPGIGKEPSLSFIFYHVFLQVNSFISSSFNRTEQTTLYFVNKLSNYPQYAILNQDQDCSLSETVSNMQQDVFPSREISPFFFYSRLLEPLPPTFFFLAFDLFASEDHEILNETPCVQSGG